MENLKRNNFTAIFDHYEEDKLYGRKYHLKNVRHEHGMIVKARYWLKPEVVKDLDYELMYGQLVRFSAILEETPNYADGFKLLEPIILKLDTC